MKKILPKLMILSALLMLLNPSAKADTPYYFTWNGELRDIYVDHDEDMPQPYVFVDDLLKDNPDFSISTSSIIQQMTLVHTYDKEIKLHPQYREYLRHYVIEDPGDNDYVHKHYLTQRIFKKITGATIYEIRVESEYMKLYWENANLDEYVNGIMEDDSNVDYDRPVLFDDEYIKEYLNVFFPSMCNYLNEVCDADDYTMTYTDKKVASGVAPNRCYTTIRRTHFIDRKCNGMTYRFVAILNFKILHYNAVITYEGVMDTIKVKETEAYPAPYKSLNKMLSGNPKIRFINGTLTKKIKIERVEFINSDGTGDQLIYDAEGRKIYKRTYLLSDKCEPRVTADMTQFIVVNGTVDLGKGEHSTVIYHPDDDLSDYNEGALYDKDKIMSYLRTYFPGPFKTLDDKCESNINMSYTEEKIFYAPFPERCYTTLVRTHNISKVCDGITYIYTAIVYFDIRHYNETITSTGNMSKIEVKIEDGKPEPYTSFEALKADNAALTINAEVINKVELGAYREETIIDQENRKEYKRYYTLRDKCDNSVTLELSQDVVLRDINIVGEKEINIDIYHPDDQLMDYNDGELYNELKIDILITINFSESDQLLDEACADAAVSIDSRTYEDVYVNKDEPLQDRCITHMKRTFHIDRECDGFLNRYIAIVNYYVHHYNRDVKITGSLRDIEEEAWSPENVPIYTSIKEMAEFNNLYIEADNMDRLELIHDRDEPLNDDVCNIKINRYYKIQDPCTFKNGDLFDNIDIELKQYIELRGRVKVEGPMNIYKYKIGELPTNEHNTIEHLTNYGAMLDGLHYGTGNILITHKDIPDEKLPYVFEREFIVKYDFCEESADTIYQRYEPDIIHRATLLDKRTVLDCDLETANIEPVNNKEAILEYLKDKYISDPYDDLIFNVTPFNEYEGKLEVYYVDNIDQFDYSACGYDFVRRYYFIYEYYGSLFRNFADEHITIKAHGDEEEFEVTGEIENDTLPGFYASDLPKAFHSVAQFEERGVTITQPCGLEQNIGISYEDELDDETDCEARYIRTYYIKDNCSEKEPKEVEHTIVLYKTLKVEGKMKTIYYDEDEDCPEAEDNVKYIQDNGGKIVYSKSLNELEVTHKDYEDDNTPCGRVKRTYYVQSPCDTIIDSITQFLAQKSSYNSMFEIVKWQNISDGGSNDGKVILQLPAPSLDCDDCLAEDIYEFVLKDIKDNVYELKEIGEDLWGADNLPAGNYILDVFPKNFFDTRDAEMQEPIYRCMGKITEQNMGVSVEPWMSFSSYNFYVESFGHHFIYGDDKYDYDSYEYIQNNKNSKWRYFFTVEGGKLINSIWDGDETWQFYPSIQKNYESNSIVWKPGETVQLTMNSTYITFHAVNEEGKELTDRKIIYRSKICLSNDPNEIYGPAGYGDDKMIAAADRIEYKIMFENDPELATAAASRVKITCPLHENAKSNTVRLGQYGFGDYIFDVPPMSTYYNTRHDLADSLGVWLDVNAGIDVNKNEMYWIFQSIDPETGVAPVDAIGFLPVNDTLIGNGEGFVTFSVLCDDGMMTGDTISEQADIIFDENDNILTNIYTNMFDAVAPTSVSVCDSSSVTYDNSLVFKSVAADDENGSGVRQVDLYVNVDNTQYIYAGSMFPDTIGTADTMALSYRLGKGSLYQFVLQAVDNVGNKETFPDVAQITYVNNSSPLDIFLSNRSFDEDAAMGTLIGEFSTIDDQSSSDFTYSFVDDENYDNNLFKIEGNKLYTDNDFRCYGEYVYQIMVRTTDINGGNLDKLFILFVNPNMTPDATVIEHYLCDGDFVEIAGDIIFEDGYYYDTLSTIYGCDSIIKHIVKHRPDAIVTEYIESVCIDEDYDKDGIRLSWDDIQTYLNDWDEDDEIDIVIKLDTINDYGCADTISLYLTVYPEQRSAEDIIVCANDMPYTYGDSLFVAAGTKEIYFTSKLTGCDSIVTVNLEIAPSHFDVPVYAAICENEYYMLFDDTIREAGTYYGIGESIYQCDSSVVLTLDVIPLKYGNDVISICASELPYTFGDYTFDESTVSGNYKVVFPASNGCDSIVTLDLTVRQDGSQQNEFSGTWDWFSSYIDDEHTDVFAELKDGLSSYGKVIKSNTKFVNYSGGVWSGNLDNIKNEQMYMVQTNMPQTTSITGCVANPEDHPITIKNGWNHIGYISQYSADVNEALAGLNVTPQDGDIIKSYRDGFAVYFESFDMWFGDLTILQPGQGYQYMSQNNDDITLTYPQMSQNRGERKSMLARNWTPSYKYPDNMTFIADIVVDDMVHNSDTLEVGAFCNGEQRGNARAIYIKEVGAYRLFLTTYGNEGDELYFMLYDHESGEVAAQVSNQRVSFEVNATYGSLVIPFSFEFNTKYNTLIETDICLGETYEENGFKENLAGSYFNRLKDENGNDSIVKLKLGINPVYRIAEDVIVEQFPYEYDGTWIEEAGVHTFNYTSVHGCDSIMVCSFIPIQETMNLMLTPNPADKKERVMVLYNFTEEEKAGLVVEVYNNLGVKVQSMEPTRFPIELREIYASGSYVIRVITGTGKILTAKLVIM